LNCKLIVNKSFSIFLATRILIFKPTVLSVFLGFSRNYIC